MSVREAVEAELAGQSGSRVEIALALATDVDKRGTAAAAKELRVLLDELGATSSAGRPKKETGLSEFERRLAERAKAPRRRTGTGA